MALEQPLECARVPCPRAVEQMKGRLWIRATRRFTARGLPRTRVVFRHVD